MACELGLGLGLTMRYRAVGLGLTVHCNGGLPAGEGLSARQGDRGLL